MPPLDTQVDALVRKVGRILALAGQGILSDAAEDLEKLGIDLSRRLVKAAAEGNERTRDILQARLMLLVERHRIRSTAKGLAALAEAVDLAWDFLRDYVMPDLLGKALKALESVTADDI